MSGKHTLNHFAGSGPLFLVQFLFQSSRPLSESATVTKTLSPIILPPPPPQVKMYHLQKFAFSNLAKRARHFWDNSHTERSSWDPLTGSLPTFSQSQTCKRLQIGNSKMIKAFWLFQISNCDFVNQGHTDRHEQFGSPGHKLGPSTTEDGPGVSPDRLKLQECGLSNTSILITECDGWKVVRPSFDNYLLYEFAKGIFTLLCYVFNEIIQGTSWESNRR